MNRILHAMQLRGAFRLVVLLALVFAALASPPPARAASILVNVGDGSVNACSTTGAGTCSLVDAITYANSNAGTDTITFDGDYTITLGAFSLPNISTTMSIDGTGHSIVLDGNNSYRLFYLSSTADLSLTHLTVQNGIDDGGGGVFVVQGTLNATDVTFGSNSTTTAGGGAGIFSNGGDVTVADSTFGGNVTEDGGGAIYNDGGTLDVTSSAFSGNAAIACDPTSPEDVAVTGGSPNVTGTTTTFTSYLTAGSWVTLGTYDSVPYQVDSVTSDTAFTLTKNYTGASNSSTPIFTCAADGDGGAIYNTGGTATVTGSTFSNNSGSSAGAIYNDSSGTLDITGSTFNSNQALGPAYTSGYGAGGAIQNSQGVMSIASSTFDSNSASSSSFGGIGGAIEIDGSSPSTPDGITDSTFTGNSADDGGAIYVYNGSSNISGSTFDSNSADHTSGSGGALDLTFNGAAAVANSTFYGNSAFEGGAIYTNSNSTTVTNATLSGNTAYEALGGGGIYGYVSGPALQNVILWGDKDNGGSSSNEIGQSTSPLAVPSIDHSVVEGGDGGIGDGTGTAWSSGTGNLDTDPKLESLADNTGPTHTMALLTGSSAINTGDNTVCAADAGLPAGGALGAGGVDQRGVTRPVGTHCDIGAYESQVLPASTDFEFDGKTDPAKYVPSTGGLYYTRSYDGQPGGAFLGTDGDYVLNSDFDGDGRTDPAKYVSAAGAIWYIGSVDNSWHGVYIGSDGDFIPASDFDGDGITDPAKYVAAAGAVWYFGSADSTWHGLYLGSLNGGTYVPGSDFDGDGKTDPAYIDTSGNVWYLGSVDSTIHGLFIGADGTYHARTMTGMARPIRPSSSVPTSGTWRPTTPTP